MTENDPARLPAGAAGAPCASRTGNAVTRRGDLVVIHLRHRDCHGGQPREYDDFWVGQVTSVTRAGLVRLYRPAGTFAWDTDGRGRPHKGQPLPSLWFERAAIKSQAGDQRPRRPRHGGLPCLARPRGPGPRLRNPRRGQGRAAPAPARAARLGTAPRRRRCLGGRPAGGPPAAERGGPRPRRGMAPPVGPLRRRPVTAANSAYRAPHGRAAGTGSAAA